MLHAGGRRLEDVRELQAEQEGLAHLGLQGLPSTDARGDWLRRMGKSRGVAALQAVNRELIGSYLQAEPGEVTLDVDATILCAEGAASAVVAGRGAARPCGDATLETIPSGWQAGAPRGSLGAASQNRKRAAGATPGGASEMLGVECDRSAPQAPLGKNLTHRRSCAAVSPLGVPQSFGEATMT